MLDKLGALGLVGIVLLLAGFAVITYANWQVALGMALVVGGLGLVVKAMISNMLGAFGMGGGGGLL